MSSIHLNSITVVVGSFGEDSAGNRDAHSAIHGPSRQERFTAAAVVRVFGRSASFRTDGIATAAAVIILAVVVDAMIVMEVERLVRQRIVALVPHPGTA